MRRTRGCLRNTPIFLAVRKRCQRHLRLIEEGGVAGTPAPLIHTSPCCWAASPAALFLSGRPNHGRCPRLFPKVLPLTFTSYLDESEAVVNEGYWPLASGGEISRGLLGSPLPQVENLLPRVPVLEMLAMQRCPDRCSPENESFFLPSSLAKLLWQESATDSLGL